MAVIALVAALYGYVEYKRGNKDLVYAKADHVMNSTAFIRDFESNEKAANEKYLDKIIAVNGTVKDILKDDGGSYTVMIGDNVKASSVRCSFDVNHQSAVASLQLGTVVIIKGVCTGFNADELLGSDVILNRCVIEKK